MAYQFANAMGQSLSFTKALSTAACTMFVRFTADSKGNYRALLNSRSDGAQGILLSGGAGNPLSYLWENSPDEYDAASGLSITDGVDYAAIVTISSTAAVVYLGDGSTVNSFTNTKTHNAHSPSAWRIGIDNQGWDGRLSEVAIWGGTTLTLAEATALGKFASPLTVRPNGLSFYAPLIREIQDLAGGVTITNNNAATVATHPRIIYPKRRQVISVAAAAPGVTILPQVMNQMYAGAA